MLVDFFSAFQKGDSNTVIWALATLLLSLPVVLFSLSLHEASHGYVAYKLGDPTAKSFGRLTVNPIRHIDPIGAVSMLLFGIGWAKPVPINSRYFKKPKRDMALSSIAGPLSNLLQAIVASLLLFAGIRLSNSLLDYRMFELFCNFSGVRSTEGVVVNYIYSLVFDGGTGMRIAGLVLYLFYIWAFLNIALTVFNLIPIPPFDGSRVAYAFLPDKYYFGIMKYERYIMVGLLILFYFSGSFLGDIFGTVVGWVFNCFSWMV